MRKEYDRIWGACEMGLNIEDLFWKVWLRKDHNLKYSKEYYDLSLFYFEKGFSEALQEVKKVSQEGWHKEDGTDWFKILRIKESDFKKLKEARRK